MYTPSTYLCLYLYERAVWFIADLIQEPHLNLVFSTSTTNYYEEQHLTFPLFHHSSLTLLVSCPCNPLQYLPHMLQPCHPRHFTATFPSSLSAVLPDIP